MDAIFFGEGDNLFKNASGKLFINCATLSPAMHVKLEGAAAEAGCETLEGCMASSITQAREGTLYLMIGGKQEVFESVKDLLDDLSISLRFVGEAGRAAQVKALVNMVMNINTAALAEGLGIADALGLDLEMLCEIFPDRGEFTRFGNRCRGHADPGSRMLFFRRTCGQGFRHRNCGSRGSGHKRSPRQGHPRQFEKMVEQGLGELDKSGVAELTFKGRGSGS